MVLERLFPAHWLEKHFRSAVLLAAGYSAASMLLAHLIFAANAGIVSVVFLSLLLVPSMRRLLAQEERAEEHETSFHLANLYRDNKALVKTYTGIFVGVFATYFAATTLLPLLGFNALSIVKEQLFLDPAIAGRATAQTDLFISILANNWLVVAVTFLLALLIGDGAVFFVAWNASAWGAIFGHRALTASTHSGEPLLLVAATLLAIVAWHVLLEGAAYILAAISGSVISDDALRESTDPHRFLGYAAAGLLLYALLYRLAQPLTPAAQLLILIPVLIGTLYLLGQALTEPAHKEVFTYNFWLFVIAVAVFVLGALIETSVLTHSDALQQIYTNSALHTAS